MYRIIFEWKPFVYIFFEFELLSTSTDLPARAGPIKCHGNGIIFLTKQRPEHQSEYWVIFLLIPLYLPCLVLLLLSHLQFLLHIRSNEFMTVADRVSLSNSGPQPLDFWTFVYSILVQYVFILFICLCIWMIKSLSLKYIDTK